MSSAAPTSRGIRPPIPRLVDEVMRSNETVSIAPAGRFLLSFLTRSVRESALPGAHTQRRTHGISGEQVGRRVGH